MRLLLAPDSFKGSLSAVQACAALQVGARRALGNRACEILSIPLADGGEGTLEALLLGAGGIQHVATVQNPLGQPVEAHWAVLNDGRAVVEMAQASGLTLIPTAQRRATIASSFGTGELIREALDAGCRDILLGIGGSATTDGGAGALQALGARFFDARGEELEHGGAALHQLARLDVSQLDARLLETRLTILCDVSNPLCGLNGAARIYGPQKGATPQEVEALDAALHHFADVAAQTLGRDKRHEAGAGAAGGIGFGLLSFTRARLVSGIEAVLEAAHFDEKLEAADLVLTGEGSIDAQTLSGKTIAGVCGAARKAKDGAGVPVVAFGGTVKLSGAQMDDLGLLSAFALPDAPLSLEQCLEHADELLSAAAERALRLWLLK